jgi:hypothetical protein
MHASHSVLRTSLASFAILALVSAACESGPTNVIGDNSSTAGASGLGGSTQASGAAGQTISGSGHGGAAGTAGVGCDDLSAQLSAALTAAQTCDLKISGIACTQAVQAECCSVLVAYPDSAASKAYLDLVDVYKAQCPGSCALVDCSSGPTTGLCQVDAGSQGHCVLDTLANRCASLHQRLDAALARAQTCTWTDADIDCEAVVDGECCPVVVQSASSFETMAYLNALQALRDESCPTACAAVKCFAPDPNRPGSPVDNNGACACQPNPAP